LKVITSGGQAGQTSHVGHLEYVDQYVEPCALNGISKILFCIIMNNTALMQSKPLLFNYLIKAALQPL
jgi:hypothetical protein